MSISFHSGNPHSFPLLDRTAASRIMKLSLPALFLPFLCGQTHAQRAPGARSASAANRTMTIRLEAKSGGPELELADTAAHQTIAANDLFVLTLQSGAELRSSSLQWLSNFSSGNTSDAGQRQSKSLCADLADRASGARFHWCLLYRPDRSYVREQLSVTAGHTDLAISTVRLLDFPDPGARVVGSVKGSPVVDPHMFFGFESPLSWSRITAGKVQAGVSRVLPLRAGQSVTWSAVLGTYPSGQLRRAFLAYIEDERPRPYQPFLNYNTWYDIGYTNRYSEADVLDRIHAFGRELVKNRHVKMSSFVLDDGWDNPNSFWQFNSGFPNGLDRVVQAAARYQAGIGIWLSPWGGYEQQKVERIVYGSAHGYEIMNGGYALSGPKYFKAFSGVCSEMISRYHVNLFKFDGTGNADRVFPGSMFDSDFAAAIHLISQLRRQEPGIFINLTTGTYPSPFWLLHADSIWRGGDDHSFAGVGTKRQQWITYRDEQTYRNVVLRGPLFPLNSLMLHGIIYAQRADGLNSDPGNDFRDEVLSYFGSGTQMQEMYVTPSLLSRQDWDILARAAKWSRAHASILQDTHWVGGDPGKLQVYGWAAWSPKGWIITLRNPSSEGQNFTLNLGHALELPPGAPTLFTVHQPFAASNAAPDKWQAGRRISVHLQPYEVRIYQSGPGL